MQLYGIVRRKGWASPEALQAAAERSTEVGDAPGSGVRWIRSYVLTEANGQLGTFCVYEAESPDAIRAHAEAAELPVDEIVPIGETVVVRPDPAPVTSEGGRRGGQSGSSGTHGPGSRPTSTARVIAADPKRSRILSSVASSS
jgi:uncharacterized protein DUF4242